MTQAIPSKRRLLVKLLTANIVSTIALGGLMLLAAGTWTRPQLWTLIIEMTVLNIGVHLWLLNDNPALLAEQGWFTASARPNDLGQGLHGVCDRGHADLVRGARVGPSVGLVGCSPVG
ncbi:hypothetical protein [Mycobacterium sp. D16R24]|uniref:hypothetical protein n=1 Tax=Mycobacterium sp. D16R24 TaxID=1855656 RepID=UPI001592765D|nr:hypothetical protein [Mycobacterium sp. D16R24]